ncbi:transmembrane signal receptor [Lithospermum erythrorhizon]|uniref:Transmembrane signal receptor n=1 Tax=Lithospermum erythrorhizon TaxID=34254 RepID=A0AAV3RYG6_LITER
MKDLRTKRTLLTSSNKNSWYPLPTFQALIASNVSVSPAVSFKFWHAKLSHPNNVVVFKLVSSKLINFSILPDSTLCNACLPSIFWVEALYYAIFLINVLPSQTLKYQTPFALLHKKPPDLKYIKEFGCPRGTSQRTSGRPLRDTPPFTQQSLSSSLPASSPSPHLMQTRSKSGIHKPRHVLSLTATSIGTPSLLHTPSCFTEVVKHKHWRQAMSDEYNALISNNTWSFVPSDPAQHLIGCKSIFRVKLKCNGTLDKYKTRLVAQGYKKLHGVDYEQTFSPVIKPTTIRIVLTLAISNPWSIRQLDIKNAFLNGALQETVYMKQSAGFINSYYPSHVCLLKKSLYGLK